MKDPTDEDRVLIRKALRFAAKAHQGQERHSGDPYVIHTFETSKHLAIFGMDATTIAAGLLHDTLEDTETTEEVLLEEFGEEILFLVKGVTKLGKLKYRGLERHVESLRKLFVATAQDIRVLIIKLADRLHNMETLDEHISPEKKKRIALETLEIFAPLANRLGMSELKGSLEDYAFPYTHPEEYARVTELLGQRTKVNQKYIAKARRTVQKEMAKHDLQYKIKTDSRVKHKYSLYKKLMRKDMDIDKIHDIIALRIIVPSIEDCYRVLGIIHGMWTPLPHKIKDYIATPKPSGYQSLHTTVFTGDGGIIEIQIRTDQMHHEAKYGIASHGGYKEGLLKQKNKKGKLYWIQQLIEWQKNVSESNEFLENLKMDFFKDRVFVFTPQGDVIDLPEDSSVIDFAYTIHSDIGHRAAGARVNGKFVSLDTKLGIGDIVEVETKKDGKPSQKWMNFATTTGARRHIRIALQKESEE